jgi:hypothetical protein
MYRHGTHPVVYVGEISGKATTGKHGTRSDARVAKPASGVAYLQGRGPFGMEFVGNLEIGGCDTQREVGIIGKPKRLNNHGTLDHGHHLIGVI